MDTRAGKRKAEQASDLPADGGAADSGSKIFDLAAYRVAVENANAYAADALKSMKDFHCATEEAVRYTLGMNAQDILGDRTMTQSWSNAMSMATRAAEATAYLASPACPKLTAPFEDFAKKMEQLEAPFEDFAKKMEQLEEESKLRNRCFDELEQRSTQWEMRLNEALEEERNARNTHLAVVVKELKEARSELALSKKRVEELKEVRSELALSKKRVEDLEGGNVVCMDAEALLELRKVLENSLRLVKIAKDRRACLRYVPEILPLAECPLTKQCMTNPVVAADGNTYERSAIEKWIQAAGEKATSPLTGEKLASHDLVIDWTMRKDIDDAVDKALAQKARGD